MSFLHGSLNIMHVLLLLAQLKHLLESEKIRMLGCKTEKSMKTIHYLSVLTQLYSSFLNKPTKKKQRPNGTVCRDWNYMLVSKHSGYPFFL